MKKTLIVFITLLAILASLLITTVTVFAEEDEGTVIFVDGSKKNDGDGSKAKPFNNLNSAQDYINKQTSGNYIVKIAGGTYELDKTLTIDENHEEGFSVRYEPLKEGDYPVISGGKHITTKWVDEGDGIYSTELNRDTKLRSLYVNGERCYMTSRVIQGTGSSGSYTVTAGQADWAWVNGEAKTTALFVSDEIPTNTINVKDIELQTGSDWNTTIVCAEKIEKKGVTTSISLQMPYGAIAQTTGWGNEYGFTKKCTISNVFEWLENPGEFYFDKTNHKLYYIPREGENLKKADVVVPELETLVEIKGKDKEHKAKNVTFKNIIFEYTSWNLCEVDGSFGRACNQANAVLLAYTNKPSEPEKWHNYIYRSHDMAPAAITAESADNIMLKNVVVRHTGNEGITFVNDVSNSKITGCAIYDTAASAIVVGHPQHMFIGDKGSDIGLMSDKEKYTASEEALCYNTIIEKSYFFEICKLFPGCPGVTVYAADTLMYKDNYMLNVPYCGLSVGWGWWNMNGDLDSSTPGHATQSLKSISILNNKFENSMLKLNDGGAIYTLGKFEDSVCNGNYILNIGTEGNGNYKIRGIHQDEGTKFLTGKDNVIDIKNGYAAVDIGNWGRKGYNTWTKIYSSTSSYSTEPSYEEGSSVELIYCKDAEWPSEAQAIIAAAGNIDKDAIDNMMGFETYYKKTNVGLIVGLSIGGAILLAGVGIGIYFVIKKKKTA